MNELLVCRPLRISLHVWQSLMSFITFLENQLVVLWKVLNLRRLFRIDAKTYSLVLKDRLNAPSVYNFNSGHLTHNWIVNVTFDKTTLELDIFTLVNRYRWSFSYTVVNALNVIIQLAVQSFDCIHVYHGIFQPPLVRALC